jgi:PAS domain S-box-containing protein
VLVGASEELVRKSQIAERYRCSGWREVGWLAAGRWLVVFAVVFSSLTGALSAAEPATEKNVLILNNLSDRSLNTVDSLQSAVRTGAPWQINFYVESLEAWRFDDKAYEEARVETLRSSYAGKKLDLVIAGTYPSLQFAVNHRDELFPGVPIVFGGVSRTRIAGQKMWPGVTGTTLNMDIRGTIDLALHLHPDTNTVAVISNNTELERYMLEEVHAELVRDQNKVKEVDLVGLPTDQLLQRVMALPPQTIVLFQQIPQDSVQPAIGAYDVVTLVGQRLPTYCILPVLCLDHGGIGGAGYKVQEVISLTAGLAKRVLSGEKPDSIPVINGTGHHIRLDWRQLRRWNIPESALPPGTEILYRPPTLWERDRKYVIATIALIVILCGLIVGLLWERARKRKAEAILRESEKRFRVMADTTPSLIWMCDSNGRVTYLNDRRAAFTGVKSSAAYGGTWTAYVHPDDLNHLQDALARALESHESFAMEYRLRRRDGIYRWMFDVASPRLNGDGSFAGFIGSAIDITDQKLAQETLEKISGRLIEAQEKERSRIARELHDDICQRLALLSIELEQANRGLSESTVNTEQRLEEIRVHCSGIAFDVQSLSHQLHSSKLDYLGVVAAIRGLCKESAKQHQVKIDFTDQNVPKDLPQDTSLCLFRVAQEALHNAVKHSATIQFGVELSGSPTEIRLEVKDAGAGFDVEEAKSNGGLGLVSMEERVHLVRGRFCVESRRGVGTKVIAILPVVAKNRGASANEGNDQVIIESEVA